MGDCWEGILLEPVELARLIADLASDKKAENIVLMDMRQVSPVTDYFVILSATSARQLNAIVDHIGDETKQQHQIRPWHVEGEADNGWMLMDYGDVVVHCFMPEKRFFYDLEGLWREAPVLVRIQ